MGTNTLNVASNPATTAQLNQYYTAINGNFVPRSASGVPETSVWALGTAAYEWKDVHVQNLYLDGTLFDPDAVGSGADVDNAITSGAVRTTSGQPDFLRALGSAATVTVLATATDLLITANGTSVTISSDIPVTSLTTAPAAPNNTCTVNDVTLTDQASSKYTGELDGNLIVDAMGSEISDRIGEYICLKTPDGEYMLAYVQNAVTLSRCYRGFFLDDSGDPISRGTLANNDTLTIMSLGWVFMDANGTTVDVSYTSPIYSATEPASPVTDDYWFDLENRYWLRYSGAAYVQVDRMLIGIAVIDATNCVASRSFDFTKSYKDHNTVDVKLFNTTVVHSIDGRSQISVYSQENEFLAGALAWDITADLESGLSEAASTLYYLYVSQDGEPKISDKKPHDRKADLHGWYHPHQSWRCVGMAYNNASSNLVAATGLSGTQEFDSSGVWINPLEGTYALIRAWGGGGSGGQSDASEGGSGGGGGGYNEVIILLSDLGATETVTVASGGAAQTSPNTNGNVGGNTTFGSLITAYGGGGGGYNTAGGGGGGNYSAGGAVGASGGILGGAAGTTGNPPTAGSDSTFGGGGGGGYDEVTGSGGNGGDSVNGGGGGAGGTADGANGATGGNSINGGAGGGGGSPDATASAGGTSINGGDGGAGAYDANNATAGSTPSGGGGGSEAGDSGAGGDGKLEVMVI